MDIIEFKQAIEKVQANMASIMKILRKHHQESKESIMTVYCSSPDTNTNEIPKVEFRFPFNEQMPDMLAHCADDDLYQNEYPWISSLFLVLKNTTEEELPNKTMIGIPKTKMIEAKVDDIMYYLRALSKSII